MANIIVSGLPIKGADEYIDADGSLVQRLIPDVPGHNVAIIVHNRDTSAAIVQVDDAAAQIPLDKADQYIRNRI